MMRFFCVMAVASIVLLAAFDTSYRLYADKPSDMRPTEKALWTANLRTTVNNWDEFHTPAFFLAQRQIAFGSDAELIIAKDSGPFAKPNQVHGYILNAASGKVLGDKEWTSGSRPFLFATHEGKYAVVNDVGMTLYSQGFHNIVATGTDVADKISPDGRYLSSSKSVPGHGITILIDATTLKPTGIEFRDIYVWSIAENRIASSAFRGSDGVMLVSSPTKQLWEHQTDCKEARPNFITNDVLALVGCERLDVVSMTRGNIFSSTLKGDAAFFAAVSRNRERFAVLQIFTSPGDPPSVSMERISVFDADKQQPIFTTDVSDLKGFNPGASSGVALSPNGSSLAINSAGIVRLFALSPK